MELRTLASIFGCLRAMYFVYLTFPKIFTSLGVPITLGIQSNKLTIQSGDCVFMGASVCFKYTLSMKKAFIKWFASFTLKGHLMNLLFNSEFTLFHGSCSFDKVSQARRSQIYHFIKLSKINSFRLRFASDLYQIWLAKMTTCLLLNFTTPTQFDVLTIQLAADFCHLLKILISARFSTVGQPSLQSQTKIFNQPTFPPK